VQDSVLLSGFGSLLSNQCISPQGRYMLWPMGLFAVYMGFVYNDVFSLGISLSPSTWQFTSNTVEVRASQLSLCSKALLNRLPA
jgi:hypothetical protein